MSAKVLFACSKCFSRHPFEELSSGQQMCKSCRGNTLVSKCTYCRSEYNQAGKSNTSGVCKNCDQHLKQYGKPSACECCNINAAFAGSKCQRCANSESKYGPPVQCEQCKQRCAFDRHDENKKVEGKLLCYHCTLSYKRAVLKARQAKEDSRMAKKRPHPTDKASTKESSGSSMKKSSSQRTDMNSKQQSSGEAADKNSRHTNSNNNGGGAAAAVTIDPNSSDHVVAMTELREQIASLQKKLTMKDKELLEKDKLITQLKGRNFDNANEMRNKLKETERMNEMKTGMLNKKVSTLLKEVATLKKSQKKNGTTGVSGAMSAITNSLDQKESSKDSGGSGTNSPITN